MLHVGTPGFGFAAGEIWAVHVGWSGNHTHYAERLSTGEQVIGGGELLLPGEIILGRRESYRTPWVYGAYGVGLDARGPAVPSLAAGPVRTTRAPSGR